MKELTGRQMEVLSFIKECINSHYPPTIREIARHFDISIKGVQDHLLVLKQKDRIRMGKGARTIELVKEEEQPTDLVNIPILGSVAAGIPINVESNWEGSVSVQRSVLKGGGDHYALRVQGDSMTGAGILDGDIAIIKQTNNVENGDIVVVQVNDSTTLKRFYYENARVKLQPENPAYQPIFGNLENIRILGLLVYLVRHYN
ncbi:MAG: transcriptional repressor LexA [Treponema sp.]|jgi:repressor LexA|nr:transcriptional repressor LexA [Treponema sp.]